MDHVASRVRSAGRGEGGPAWVGWRLAATPLTGRREAVGLAVLARQAAGWWPPAAMAGLPVVSSVKLMG